MAHRTWIVSLQARSAVRFAANTQINLLASPQSTIPVVAVRLRNLTCLTDNGPEGETFVGAVVAEAAGRFESAEAAVAILGNLAAPYFLVAALAGNAAVDDPQDVLAFAPPAGDEDGQYVVQRASNPRSPAPVVRDLHAKELMEVLKPLGEHERNDRLHRAIAHFALALDHLRPGDNWVLSAEHLYVAVENLARVVAQRLQREAGLVGADDWKHRLALQQGFAPKHDNDRSHLGKFDSWVREQHIFEGDRECHKQLLDASDAFEHGYKGFDKIRALATASTRSAFGHVRRAILREVGVPATSALFSAKYDIPLGDWKPVLEVDGTYTDSASKSGPGFTGDDFQAEWPDFLGPSLFPRISRVVDLADGSRTISLKVEGDMHALSVTQTLHIGETRWLLPSGKAEPANGELELTEFILNGNDLTERLRAAAPDEGPPESEAR